MNLNALSKLDAAKQKLTRETGPAPADARSDQSGGLTRDETVVTSELGHTAAPLETPAPIDPAAWSDAVHRARLDARVASWSPPGKIVLEYLAGTTIRFSKSEVVRMALEHWIQVHHPRLWEAAIVEQERKLKTHHS